MKKFLKYSLIIAILLTGIISIIVMTTNYITAKNAIFQIETKPKYVIIGHSHPECAYNDAVIPHLKNLSKSGESYFYNFAKTKKIIEQNNSLEVVFIEFTNNNLSIEMDDWIWGDKYISYHFPIYEPFINSSDKLLLFQNNPSGYLNAISNSIKHKFKNILKNDFDYVKNLGGYKKLIVEKVDSILIHSDSLSQTAETRFSNVNLKYLSMLIDYCKEKNKKVILIRTPQHLQYSGLRNEKQYQEILNMRYSNIEYLDFSKFPIKKHEFADLEHLNHKGATIFSKWFAKLLEEGLINKKNKREFVDEMIQMEIEKIRN